MQRIYKILLLLCLATLHLVSSTTVIYFASSFAQNNQEEKNNAEEIISSVCEYFKYSSIAEKQSKSQFRVISINSFVDIFQDLSFRYYFQTVKAKISELYIGYRYSFIVEFETTDIIYPFHYFL